MTITPLENLLQQKLDELKATGRLFDCKQHPGYRLELSGRS